MSRDARKLGLLALVAVALVAAVLWTGRLEYDRQQPTLTTLDPAAVTRIELDIPSISQQVFERRHAGWWRVKPSAARAVDARVERLAQLASTPVVRWLDVNAVVPAKVGLAQPSATLLLNGTRLEYGGLTALDEMRYVRVGNKVALVPRQYSPEVAVTKPAGD